VASGAEPRYPYVAVDVASDEVDERSAQLFELGAEGVEERDATTLARGEKEGKVTLVASFADQASARAAMGELDASLAPRLEEIVGDAWRDAWKAHFVPFRLTPHVIVRPPWESFAPESPEDRVLELEPGRAFGTGLHASTLLVARLLDEHRAALSGSSVLDVGTGSGILSLVALTFGAVRAIAIDVDAEAVAVARENAVRNGFSAQLSADVTPIEEIVGQFRWVLANIEARVLLAMADPLAARLTPDGKLILSGILGGQEDELIRAYQSLRLESIVAEGEWRALVFSRPAGRPECAASP
jgi:ribosomal protein L11 methyltransferase